jgi:hypothetical protein
MEKSYLLEEKGKNCKWKKDEEDIFPTKKLP